MTGQRAPLAVSGTELLEGSGHGAGTAGTALVVPIQWSLLAWRQHSRGVTGIMWVITALSGGHQSWDT